MEVGLLCINQYKNTSILGILHIVVVHTMSYMHTVTHSPTSKFAILTGCVKRVYTHSSKLKSVLRLFILSLIITSGNGGKLKSETESGKQKVGNGRRQSKSIFMVDVKG